jgi:hypothetical protein
MRRGLPSFGTVWYHPSRGGATLPYPLERNRTRVDEVAPNYENQRFISSFQAISNDSDTYNES